MSWGAAAVARIAVVADTCFPIAAAATMIVVTSVALALDVGPPTHPLIAAVIGAAAVADVLVIAVVTVVAAATAFAYPHIGAGIRHPAIRLAIAGNPDVGRTDFGDPIH